MTSFEKTPLDCWIAGKIGLQPSAANAGVNRFDLALYQLEKLRKIVDYAKKNSPFYARHLSQINTADHGLDLKSIGDITSLPFTTSEDLVSHGLQMLCVSQSQIARVITLQTSGTTGPPKRIYFTEEDLELTADFFFPRHAGHGFTRRSGNGLDAWTQSGFRGRAACCGP